MGSHFQFSHDVSMTSARRGFPSVDDEVSTVVAELLPVGEVSMEISVVCQENVGIGLHFLRIST